MAGALNRPGMPRSQTLKIACADCNNGWMKLIVDDAIPILKLIGAGSWWDLSERECNILSSWLTLFTMTYEFADRSTVAVSTSERAAFRLLRSPSSHWHIAIGIAALTPGQDPTFHRCLALSPDVIWSGNRKSQITALAFGTMLAVTHYAEHPIDARLDELSAKLGLLTIWPTATKSRLGAEGTFKPLQVYDDERFETIVPIYTDAVELAPAIDLDTFSIGLRLR